MNASQDFRLKWEETKISIHEQLAELENMRLFYENYHSSYDGLLLEVWRRRQTEEKVKIILRKAVEQVDRVLQVDQGERAAFRSDFGEYLPVDLWSGVNSNPPMWDFVKRAAVSEDGVEEGNLESVPELEKSVVEAAHRRDRARQKAER
jgi:autophagy-related protein 17